MCVSVTDSVTVILTSRSKMMRTFAACHTAPTYFVCLLSNESVPEKKKKKIKIPEDNLCTQVVYSIHGNMNKANISFFVMSGSL